MPSRIARLGWKLFQPLLRRLRPSELVLQNLSQKDRPGLTIELPDLVTCEELLRRGRAELGRQKPTVALSTFRSALELSPSHYATAAENLERVRQLRLLREMELQRDGLAASTVH